MSFKIKGGESLKTTLGKCASATAIPVNSVVVYNYTTQTWELCAAALTAYKKTAYTFGGSAIGETDIVVTIGNDFTLVGTADATATGIEGRVIQIQATAGVQTLDVVTAAAYAKTSFLPVVVETAISSIDGTSVEVRLNNVM